MVESNDEAILFGAETEDVAFLVVGDPFGYGITEWEKTELRSNDHSVQPPIQIWYCARGN